jgi:DNA-binding CsgD family transcriptional regulator
MRSANHAWKSFWGAAAAVILLSGATARSGAAPEPAVSPTGDVVSGAWQHHKVTFTYIGFTALFTCSGLEDHVRQILVHLGARKDAKVSATGCPGPIDTPMLAWTAATPELTAREREVLATAAGGATAAEVAGRLHLSHGTVRNHLSTAIQKLGARTRGEAVEVARAKGWL